MWCYELLRKDSLKIEESWRCRCSLVHGENVIVAVCYLLLCRICFYVDINRILPFGKHETLIGYWFVLGRYLFPFFFVLLLAFALMGQQCIGAKGREPVVYYVSTTWFWTDGGEESMKFLFLRILDGSGYAAIHFHESWTTKKSCFEATSWLL